MGTHIDCIIPKEKDYSIDEIKHKLKTVFERLKPEYLHLEKYGTFTKNLDGNWWIKHIPSENGEPEYIKGEGDSFSIDIYKKVICIGSIERFSSLYFEERNISQKLFKILTELSNEFRTSDKMLIGAGGFGETDHIMDMVYYEDADFDQVCKKMTELNGIPANDLSELNEKSWFLKK
ncbi:hypothetical protein [Aquimarina sp. LLG6339-5]|uniref:hypothetical protein n=1 Tax=Aquimarina sp. LLG6339-5 TaxID=3160830 RepID=UPI003866F7A0